MSQRALRTHSTSAFIRPLDLLSVIGKFDDRFDGGRSPRFPHRFRFRFISRTVVAFKHQYFCQDEEERPSLSSVQAVLPPFFNQSIAQWTPLKASLIVNTWQPRPMAATARRACRLARFHRLRSVTTADNLFSPPLMRFFRQRDQRTDAQQTDDGDDVLKEKPCAGSFKYMC